MKDNRYLKRGLIIQSLSPAFFLLIIRHLHYDYLLLFYSFFKSLGNDWWFTIVKTIQHPRFGELFIVLFGIIWVTFSVNSYVAFRTMQTAGFESNGEKVTEVEQKKDAAASFLMTFILPLLIDNLNSLPLLISYLAVICIVYAVLYQSNLYYQSPILALLGYKVFSFRVIDPYKQSGLKANTTYIGITKKDAITEEKAIIWKHIADDVFIIYSEGKQSAENG